MLGMGIGLFCCAVWVMYGRFVPVVLIFQWFCSCFFCVMGLQVACCGGGLNFWNGSTIIVLWLFDCVLILNGKMQ